MSNKTKIVIQPIGITGMTKKQQEVIADIVNKQLDKICEREELDNKILDLITNTAIDGDGCMYVYVDDTTVGSYQTVEGEVIPITGNINSIVYHC